MGYLRNGILSTVGVLLVWLQPAQGQAANELLKFAQTTTAPLYAQDASFERVLVDALFADEIMTLTNARAHPFVLGSYVLTGQKMNNQWLSSSTVIMPTDPGIVPDSVAMIAEAYRAEPQSILAGYMAYATVSETNGVVSYTVPGDGVAPACTLMVNNAEGRITGVNIGNSPSTSMHVEYNYDVNGNVSRIVVEFSTSEYPEMRWALVDFPVDASDQPQPRVAQQAARLATAAPQPQRKSSPTSKRGEVSVPVAFGTSDNLIDPINFGSTSCTASDGICFDIEVFELCFDLGLGIGLNTVSSIAMNGDANVEYPVEGREGEARVTFTGSSGTSSIDYSFAYDAEVCASASVPILGTCEVSAVLAKDSITLASGAQAFTPFLLPGNDDRPVCTGDAIDPFFIGTNSSFSICELEFSFSGGLDIDPNLDYCVSGDSMSVSSHLVPLDKSLGAKAGANIHTEGGEAWLTVEEGVNAFEAQWYGEASASGALTLTPTLGVSIPGIGDIAIPFPSFPFSLGSLGIAPMDLEDSFEVELCSKPPRAPFRMFASRGVSPSQVNLDWDAVPTATGYRVFRAEKADLSDAQDISGITTERWYSDKTATTGMGGCIGGTGPIEYYYYVIASNACGESEQGVVDTGYVADAKSLATMSLTSLGDFGVFVIALAALFVLRRNRKHQLQTTN
jgi:hypothetical protein